MAQPIKKKKTEEPRKGLRLGSNKMTKDEVKSNIKKKEPPKGKAAEVKKFLDTPLIVKQGGKSDTTTLGGYGKSLEMLSGGRQKAGQAMKDAMIKSYKSAEGYRVLPNKGGQTRQEAAVYGRDVTKNKKKKV